MLQQTIKAICCILSSLFIYNATSAQCYNGDVEANNFTNWTGWTGVVDYPGVVPWNKMVPGIVNGRQTIMNAGNDPILSSYGVNLPVVAEGSHSIRLGNSSSAKAEIIAYTFPVTSADFSFRYAMILESPTIQHELWERPAFSYFIATGNAALTKAVRFNTIKSKSFLADPASPYFHSLNNGSLVYTDWQTECIDLSGYVGQTVTIYFMTNACAYRFHTAYAYIDGLCTINNAVPDFTYPSYICVDDALSVDGSSSQGATDYYWKLDRLSSNNISNVIPNTTQIVYFYNQTPGYIADLLKGTKLKAFSFPNGYYKLTLGVKNCFGVWIEKSVVIELRLPEINVTQYAYKCCSDPVSPIFIATTTIPSLADAGEFSWIDNSGIVISTGTISTEDIPASGILLSSTFTPPSAQNGKYKVQYIDHNGCKNEKWVYVINKSDFSAGISTDFCFYDCNISAINTLNATTHYSSVDYCGSDFDEYIWELSKDDANLTYQWSTGETTKSISVHPGVTQYNVTITNGCYTHTASIDLTTFHPLGGDIESSSIYDPGKIKIPLVIYPLGGTFNNVQVPITYFTLYEWGLPAGVSPAYRATYYDFSVYDRFGVRVHHQEKYAPCEGFLNGELSWNGMYRGKYVDLGSYRYQLIIKNCDHPDGVILKGDFQVIY